MVEQSEAPVPVRNRNRRVLVAAVLVVLIAVGVVVWLVTGTGGGAKATGQPAAVTSLPGHQVCADSVRISVDTDARMTQIVALVRVDPRVRMVYTETKQQAFERFKQEFADQPQLLALGRPDALPATAVVLPVSGIDVHQLAGEFRQKFADAKTVDPMTQADSARALASIGETAPPVPCPASGEFPSH
jgi:cell division protein FtsX